jgi:Tol biopolymer transport system component
MMRVSSFGLFAIAFLLIACSDDNDPPTDPTMGSITVTLTTTGENAPTGYTVVLDETNSRSIDANGTMTFGSVSAGSHSVELTDVPANCTVTSANPAPVTASSGGATPVAMNVVCTALVGSIVVTAQTSGDALDVDGYLVSLNDGTPQSMGVNGSITISSVPQGEHVVTISGVADNCGVGGGAARSVYVAGGSTITETFEIACESDSRIAFISSRDGDYDIYVINPDGSGLLQVANSSGTDLYPRWSPDANQIAFASNRDGNVEIYAANLEDSELRNLSDDPAIDDRHSWAPDGTAIAFFSNRDPFGIYIGRLDGTPPFRIGGGTNPEWAPDGSRIVVDGMWAMNSDGTNPAKLTDDLGLDYQAAWSPDGYQIAFMRESDSGQDIYVVNADGSGMSALTSTGFSLQEEHPKWSPDGTRILFDVVSGPGGPHGVYVMNADGSGAVLLADGRAPSWSPNGSRIAFASSRDGNNDIYVMNADGSGQTRLTESGASDLDPMWSPSSAHWQPVGALAACMSVSDGSCLQRTPASVGQ